MKHRAVLKSRMQIHLTSANIWGSIQLLNSNSIPVYDIKSVDDLTISMEIDSWNLFRVKALLEKRGDKITVQKQSGLLLSLQRLRKRPVLCIGLLVLSLLFLFLPTRVLFVQVEGNQTISTKQILEAAEASGIGLWASRRAVRSEKIKNELLSAIPELQWAGINTYGCKAVISVRERSAGGEPPDSKSVISSIVAQRDGIVSSVTVVRGNVLCREGQAVKKGQILISGYIDCGFCIRAVRADGEIYADTLHEQSCVMPDSYTVRREEVGQEKKYSLILGKKRINLWKGSGIWDSSCGKINTEYRVTLPGGYSLPIALSCETLTYYDQETEQLEKSRAEEALRVYSQSYLESRMIAGVIGASETLLEASSGCYTLKGAYHCTEMIGREHLETGVPYEQNN